MKLLIHCLDLKFQLKSLCVSYLPCIILCQESENTLAVIASEHPDVELLQCYGEQQTWLRLMANNSLTCKFYSFASLVMILCKAWLIVR